MYDSAANPSTPACKWWSCPRGLRNATTVAQNTAPTNANPTEQASPSMESCPPEEDVHSREGHSALHPSSQDPTTSPGSQSIPSAWHPSCLQEPSISAQPSGSGVAQASHPNEDPVGRPKAERPPNSRTVDAAAVGLVSHSSAASRHHAASHPNLLDPWCRVHSRSNPWTNSAFSYGAVHGNAVLAIYCRHRASAALSAAEHSTTLHRPADDPLLYYYCYYGAT